MIQRLRFGILAKFFVAMMAVTLLPLGVIWYLDHRTTVDQLTRSVEERLGLQADNAVAYVEAWLETDLRFLRQNARLDDMVAMDPARAVPLLQTIPREYPWVTAAHLSTPDGMNIARSDTEPLTSRADRNYVKQVQAGAHWSQEVAVARTTGKPSLMIAVPVTRADKLVGILTIAQQVDGITSKIGNVRIGKTGFAFLVNDLGEVVAHPTIRTNLGGHPAVAAVRSGHARQKVLFSENGKRVIAYGHKTQHGWTLVVQQDEAEAFAPLRESNRIALILLAGSVLFVGLLSGVMAPRLTGPLRNLTDIADRISRGDLDMEIEEVDRTDEIGGLARAIDRLKTSVEVAMRRLAPDPRTGRARPAGGPAPAGASAPTGARDGH